MSDWKRMFEIKQDDWLEVCKLVDTLTEKLAAAERERDADWKIISALTKERDRLRAVVDTAKKARKACLCRRFKTVGFDYNEHHKYLGKPKPGARWLTPTDMLDLALAALDASPAQPADTVTKAEGALAFYADASNWWAYKEKPNCECICVSDRQGDHGIGGRRARDYFRSQGKHPRQWEEISEASERDRSESGDRAKEGVRS